MRMSEGYYGYHVSDELDLLREQEERIRIERIEADIKASRARQANELRKKLRKMGYKPCA